MLVLVILIYESFGSEQGAQQDVRALGGRHGKAIREIDP